MRLKFLSSQMVPWWCFAAAAAARRRASEDSDLELEVSSSSLAELRIRVVGADGVVRLYDSPVSAAEVMADSPCHLVCRADAAFTIGQKVPALSAADRLLPGHSYFLLPSHFFHSVLSFVSLASSLLLAAPPMSLNGGGGGGGSRKVRPFRVCRSATGALQIIVCSGDGDGDGGDDDRLVNSNKNTKAEAEDEKERMSGSRVCTDEALEKEYREMVGARRERRWTPKLETIGECEMDRRRRGGGGGGEGFMVLGFVGRRRRRKRGTTQ